MRVVTCAACRANGLWLEQGEPVIRFDLTTLELFLSTVELGSIAASAEANAIAPSAVSRRISDLEHRLGTSLLYRKTRGVEPTPAGETLARHARSLIRLTSRMEAEMSEFAEGVRGHVRIVANTSAITQFLPRDLLTFKTNFPDVRIQLSEETSTRAVHDVSEGLADIAIFSEAISAGDLDVFPYRQDQLAVVAPTDHPIATHTRLKFADTLSYVHVGLQDGSSLHGQLVDQANELERPINFAVQVTSFDGVQRMVEGGLGIAILPSGTVPPQTKETGLKVIPLSDGWAKRKLYVGVREARALSRVARQLLQELVGGEHP